jgi:hypothetical protein
MVTFGILVSEPREPLPERFPLSSSVEEVLARNGVRYTAAQRGGWGVRYGAEYRLWLPVEMKPLPGWLGKWGLSRRVPKVTFNDLVMQVALEYTPFEYILNCRECRAVNYSPRSVDLFSPVPDGPHSACVDMVRLKLAGYHSKDLL